MVTERAKISTPPARDHYLHGTSEKENISRGGGASSPSSSFIPRHPTCSFFMVCQLPLEVWYHVLRYLPNADLATLSLASHRLSDAAIRQTWLRPIWRLADAEKILTAVTRRKQQQKPPRILVITLNIELPESLDTIAELCLALDQLIEMGVKVEQVSAVYLIPVVPYVRISCRSFFTK